MQFDNHEVQSRAVVALTPHSAEIALETAFSPKILIFIINLLYSILLSYYENC